MPDPSNQPLELSPGYVACATCGRVVRRVHVNTAGRCVLCASTAEASPEKPATASATTDTTETPAKPTKEGAPS